MKTRRQMIEELNSINIRLAKNGEITGDDYRRAMKLVNELYIFYSASISDIINTLRRQRGAPQTTSIIRTLEESLQIEGVK